MGDKRIGVALASPIARIASPFMVLGNDSEVWNNIAKLIASENIGIIVVGLPRSLDGNETEQTKTVLRFADKLKQKCQLEIVMQDEALTSRQAEAELRNRGKQFAKGDIDALAATYILEDYLRTISSDINRGIS